MKSREDEREVHAGGLIDVDLEVGTEELRSHLADVLSKVAYGCRRVLVTRNGRPVAVILPVEDAKFYAALEDENDRAGLQAVEEAAGTGRG